MAPLSGTGERCTLDMVLGLRTGVAVAEEEEGVDPIWRRLAAGNPTSEDAAHILLLGGIPGVCGPGRTAQERATIMKHNRDRAEVASNLSLTTTTSRSSFGQTLLTDVASSEEELMLYLSRAFKPSRVWSLPGLGVFLRYFFVFAIHAGWMYFAMPAVSTHLESLPEALGEWFISARNWLDAPAWVFWMSFCASGARVLIVFSILTEHAASAHIRSADFAGGLLWISLFGVAWDIVSLFYLKRTDASVNNWESDAVGHRVGTFFLVCVGPVVLLVMLVSIFLPSSYTEDKFDDLDDHVEDKTAKNINIRDWDVIKLSAASVLRVKDSTLQLEDKAGLVGLLECLFKLVDGREAKNAVQYGTHVHDQHSAMVWLCIDALVQLPETRRDPNITLSTICSFGVTLYDCFSSLRGWYVKEPALARVMKSTTGRVNVRFSMFTVEKGRPTRSLGRAYVETSSGSEDTCPSFEHPGESSSSQPYPGSAGVVRVSIPTRPKRFVSKPEHTGSLGLVNTAAAIWFLVHWELDVYHVFLAGAVCGEMWAQLWVGIWWCAGEAPLAAFVDPVHWLIGRREHVPAGAVRLLAGEASAAVIGVVGALTVIDNLVAGGVVGAVALVVGSVLKKFAKGEDVAVVCFLAYLSELILEVVIVVTGGDFTLVTALLGVTAALESMILTIRLLQVLVGRSLIGRKLPAGVLLTEMRENWFARPVACGYWGAVFTGYSPPYIMEAMCSGSIRRSRQSESLVDLANRVGYEQILRTEGMRSTEGPGWGYVVSSQGAWTSTAWNLPTEKGFTVFEVGTFHGKRYPCV